MNDFIKYKDEYDYNCFHITVTPNNLNVSETIETLFNMGAKHISVDFVKSLEKQFRFSEKDMEVIKEECRKVEELILDRIRNKLCVSVHPLIVVEKCTLSPKRFFRFVTRYLNPSTFISGSPPTICIKTLSLQFWLI